MDDKAIRAAKLTLGGMLEKKRAKTAVERAQGQIAPSKYLPNVPRQAHADGGPIGMGDNGGPPLSEPPVDLGQVREQKQLQGFHQNMMSDISDAASERMEAHQKALDAGHFDGYEVGDVLKGKNAPMKITGRFVRPWKPSMQASFDRLNTQPSLIEHNGKQYVPMLRTLTGVKDSDNWQESDAYLDLVKAMGYPKMGGLRSVKARGGAIHLIHGGSDFDEIDPRYSGTGEPGNIRPLGKGLYTFILDPDDPESAKNAIGWAKRYATKYGRGKKTLHVFQVPKSASTMFNGPRSIEGLGAEPQDKLAAYRAHRDAEPAKDDPAWWDWSRKGNALYEDVKNAADLRLEHLPIGLTEAAINNPKIAQRVGKFDPEADPDEIIKAIKGYADGGTVDDLPPVGKNRNGVPEEDAVASPLRKAEYPYMSMVPARQVHAKPLRQAINKAHAEAEVMDLPIDRIVTDVSAIGRSRVKNPAGGLPLVERINGVHHLRDGNHRVAAAMLRGDKTVRALVADMDEAIKASGRADGGYVPQKTQKAYKLFRRKDGKLLPLFVNADKPVEMGKWLEAEAGPQGKAQGKVKSKLGDLAYRPGWHAGDLPIATHIGGKSKGDLKAPDYRPDDQVWAEVEMADDHDWQSVANSRGKGVKAAITDQVPLKGFYRFKTNPNMTGNWLIGGHMKVNRVLSDDDVKAINDAAGVADLPRLQRADGGAVGGDEIPNWSGNPDFQKWFGASKAVDETGSPLVLYHGTNQSIDQFDPKRGGAATGENAGATKGFFFTDNKDVAQQYADRAGRAVIPNVVEHERETRRLQREVARLEAAAHRTGNWDAYERAVEAWEDHEAKARNASDDEGKNIVHAHLSLQNPKIVDFGGGRLSMDRDLDSMIEEAKAAGHDGMILKNLEDSPQMGIVSNHYVAFAPHQIKSVHNSGRFDPKDPRIHRADGGIVERSPMFEGMHEDLYDEDGKPTELWHGTPAPEPFDAFDDAKLAKRDAGFYGRGHYLTPDRGVAEGYADPDEMGRGSVMGPMHAALKNPYVWDVSDDNKAHSTLRDLQSMGIMRGQDRMEPWDNLQRHHIDRFMQNMQQRGHDGVIYKTGQGVKEIVVFNPNMIKHRDAEVGDPNDPRIMRNGGGRVDLYSKAAQIIRGLKQEKGLAGDMVKAALGKGAKQAEINHARLPEGPVNRDDLARHLDRFRPMVGVMRKERPDFRFGSDASYDQEIQRLQRLGQHDQADALMDEWERFAGYGGNSDPKYAQYQLGGKSSNYREHILTLDSQPHDQTYYAKMHWGRTANPLAHIRMSDRQIGNRKILHIEEMQSDWNNDARRKGFRAGTEKKDYDDYVTQMRVDAINGIDPNAAPMVQRALRDKYHLMDPYTLALKMGRQEQHNTMARAAQGATGVPKAAYIDPKRDDWAEVAMKHVLTEAAKGGYDGVAFTPDEAQSERWKGTDFNGIYNKKLPSMAQRLIRQHDPQGGSDDDPQNIDGWAAPHVELTDEARQSILKNGFSAFKRGGYVTHVRRAR